MINKENALKERIFSLEQRVNELEKSALTADDELIGKEYLTIQDVCKLTGFKASRVYHMTSGKQIPYYRPGGKVIMIHRDDLKAYMTQNRFPTAEELAEERYKGTQA